jgi:parallel beta-helix repeat protein
MSNGRRGLAAGNRRIIMSTYSSGGRVRPRRAVGRATAEGLEERIALAVYTVSTTADSGAGSLRQAILDANNSPHVDDTIVFAAGVFSTPRVIDVYNPLPQFGSVSGGLSLIGPGSSLLTVRKLQTGNVVYGRVFDSFSPTLTISGMTLTGGYLSGANGAGLSCASGSNVTLDDVVITGNSVIDNKGGGIFLSNNAALTIRNSVISGNGAAVGGGIYFFDGGSLVMDNCTVSGNTAFSRTGRDVSGGGIYYFGVALPNPPAGFTPNTLVIRNSTISGNRAAGGGGGFGGENLAGTLLVRNSTISGNTAASSGGGILLTAAVDTVTLEDSTVTNNSAGGTVTGTNATGGGGVANRSIGATVNVTNSIVSGNSNPLTPDILTIGGTTNAQYSAIGSNSGFTLSAASNHNVPFGTNLLLGPLAYNGGFTQTHAVLPGSPLINAGGNALVPAGTTTDERGAGFPRVVGPAVDIGAFEQTATSAPPRVSGVYVRGSTWTPAFLNYLDSRGLGDRDVGYLVPAGQGQLATLPWIGLDRVSVRFTDNVGTFANMLTLAGANVPSYALGAPTYNASTRTVTWALNGPMAKDRVRLTLSAAVGGAGGPLDGEWADGSHTYPSGNGAAGGAFTFAFNVLPGDTTRDGSVLADDFSAVKKRFFKDTTDLTAADTSYSPFCDVTGDGTILANDFSEVKKRFFDALPVAAVAA